MTRVFLSPLQRAVARCLVSGFGDRRIAAELGISVANVKRQMRGVLDATGQSNRTAAVMCIVNSARLAEIVWGKK